MRVLQRAMFSIQTPHPLDPSPRLPLVPCSGSNCEVEAWPRFVARLQSCTALHAHMHTDTSIVGFLPLVSHRSRRTGRRCTYLRAAGTAGRIPRQSFAQA